MNPIQKQPHKSDQFKDSSDLQPFQHCKPKTKCQIYNLKKLRTFVVDPPVTLYYSDKTEPSIIY